MKKYKSILKALDFIEENLKSDINLEKIAEAAQLSLFYFIRKFSEATTLTPYDYLIRRRLTEAAKELMNSTKAIAQVSQEFNFKNHETFSRAFKRNFLLSPKDITKENFLFYRCPIFREEDLGTLSKIKVKIEFNKIEIPQLIGLSKGFEEKNFHKFPEYNLEKSECLESLFKQEQVKVKSTTYQINSYKKNGNYEQFIGKEFLETPYEPEIFDFKMFRKRKYLIAKFLGKNEISSLTKNICNYFLSCSEFKVSLENIVYKIKLKNEEINGEIYIPVEEKI